MVAYSTMDSALVAPADQAPLTGYLFWQEILRGRAHGGPVHWPLERCLLDGLGAAARVPETAGERVTIYAGEHFRHFIIGVPYAAAPSLRVQLDHRLRRAPAFAGVMRVYADLHDLAPWYRYEAGELRHYPESGSASAGTQSRRRLLGSLSRR